MGYDNTTYMIPVPTVPTREAILSTIFSLLKLSIESKMAKYWTINKSEYTL